MQKLKHMLRMRSLIIIYNPFVRPHLDYCDIIYDKPNNESFCNKIEKIQ